MNRTEISRLFPQILIVLIQVYYFNTMFKVVTQEEYLKAMIHLRGR